MKIKTFPFSLLLIAVILSLWLRLFWLQIVEGRKNRVRADENRIKIINQPALRGVIYDRKKQIIARNAPEGREYPCQQSLAHVVGFVGEASLTEIKELGLKMGAVVGKMGAEKQYDKILRGVDGGLLVETGAQGQVLREVKKIDSQPGQNLVLTLDAGLQQTAFQALAGRKGAVVAAKPNGEILALVSSPAFDPNVFSQNLNSSHSAEIKEIFADPDQPMFNRAIAGLYPPGSVFKIVTAIAG